MTESLGATAADWYHFDFELGLTRHLLPCVPAASDVVCVPGSALEGKVGKIPSQFNAMGQAHGLKDWQKRSIDPAEVALWARDRRLNLCVRTGQISGVYAIDVDVEDEKLAQEIGSVLEQQLGAPLVRRIRSNSHKFLVPFRMEGACKKRIITVVAANKAQGAKAQRIELLGDGQQFVAAGTHSSGVRYEWAGGLPSQLPLLTYAHMNSMWSTLSDLFEVDKTTATPPTTSTPSTSKNPVTTAGETLSEINEDDWQGLLQALRYLLDKIEGNDAWSEIGYALLSLKQSRPARQLWIDFSKKAHGYAPGAPEQWWTTHETQQPHSDYRHIFKLARSVGWKYTSAPSVFPVIDQSNRAGDSENSGELDSLPDVIPPPLPIKPIVRVSDAALVENIAQMSGLIRPDVFRQGTGLTRLARENLDDKIHRSTDQLVLFPVTTGWARVHFTDKAQFMKYDGRMEDWKNCSCPVELVTTWMDQSDWPELRPLDAIARAPFVRADGSICDISGYDATSRTLLLPGAIFPSIPRTPTRDEAVAALGRLLDPFDEFPWYSSGARSAFAAHILTEAARLAFDRVPMFWYTAPDAGTGKTMLSEAAATIVHGTEPAVRPWVQDGDELRKTLFASLLAGDRSIAFDNVPNGFKARAPELCAFLTSAVWKDRKLGVSETHAVPNKTVVSASGNNVTPVADLARRSIVIRLDANSEQMKLRRFKIKNLRGYLLEHRAELLMHALTVVAAYHSASGIDLTPLPSFELWSKMVREPLVWLGLPDPCETQKTETDDESGSVSEIFEMLATYMGDREFTALDIARLVGGVLDANGHLSSKMMANGCSEPNSPMKVGYWLRSQRDRLGKGLKLVHAGKNSNGVMWRLKRTDGNGDLA